MRENVHTNADIFAGHRPGVSLFFSVAFQSLPLFQSAGSSCERKERLRLVMLLQASAMLLHLGVKYCLSVALESRDVVGLKCAGMCYSSPL